ncbi:hypothetical protein LEN26_007098 [Aphanomyces euteiches]|nr:hypothetical protein AeMF1_019032 [Aphanomyces euteiches]KAH9133466.1 hypothetical protein LEN26_007098 [Aphanomyces euteiches]KAH9192629.1 hypothetical protein AeNC1_005398 [Aphanomyces euteiches]
MGEEHLWAAKAVCAINSFASSAQNVYLPVFFSAYFNKFQIGILATIPCVCTMVSPPIWGAVADLFRRQRLIHVFCLVTATLLWFAIQYTASGFTATCVLVFVATFQIGPTGALLDQAIMALIECVGSEYGKQRLLGAIGWGSSAFLTGLVVNAYGISWSFNIFLIALVPNLIALRYIPPPDAPTHTADGGSPSLSFAHGMRRVFKKTDVLLLLLVVLLTGIMLGTATSYLTLNLYELSHSTTLIGVAIWLETLSELPAFFFADELLKRIGIVNTLFISILGYAARITCYALMTEAWMALPFELLHGVTYSLSWTAFAKYIYEAAPPGTQGTMMGLLNSMNGVGRGFGILVGGYLYEDFGVRVLWWVADLGVPLALLGLFVFSKSLPSAESRLEVVRLISPKEIDP